jgi:hypothetical protein
MPIMERFEKIKEELGNVNMVRNWPELEHFRYVDVLYFIVTTRINSLLLKQC